MGAREAGRRRAEGAGVAVSVPLELVSVPEVVGAFAVWLPVLLWSADEVSSFRSIRARIMPTTASSTAAPMERKMSRAFLESRGGSPGTPAGMPVVGLRPVAFD